MKQGRPNLAAEQSSCHSGQHELCPGFCESSRAERDLSKLLLWFCSSHCQPYAFIGERAKSCHPSEPSTSGKIPELRGVLRTPWAGGVHIQAHGQGCRDEWHQDHQERIPVEPWGSWVGSAPAWEESRAAQVGNLAQAVSRIPLALAASAEAVLQLLHPDPTSCIPRPPRFGRMCCSGTGHDGPKPPGGLWGQSPHTVRGPLASVPTRAVTCWALPGFGRGWEVGEEKRSCLAPGGLWQMAQVFGPLRQDRSCRPQRGGGSSPGTAPTLPHVPMELQGFGEFLEWEPTQVGVLLSARPGG